MRCTNSASILCSVTNAFILIITALLLASVAARAQQQTKPDKPRHDPDARQQPTPQTPEMITIQNLSTGNDKADADKKQTSAPLLSRGEMISYGTGIGVLFVSVLAWWAVYRQANIMERTLRMQESALRQWIYADNWEIRVDESNSIFVHCMANNPTDTPLWLESVEFIIGGGHIGVIQVATWLIPKTPFAVDMVIVGTAEHRKNFVSGLLAVILFATFFFEDALKNKWREEMQIVLAVTPVGSNVREHRILLGSIAPPRPIRLRKVLSRLFARKSGHEQS